MPADLSRKVGLFGGTFDPPHLGHVVLATEARFRLGLDELLLVVANDPWQKSATTTITPADVRVEMVRAAVDGHQGLSVSEVEVRRGGPTYTIDTVEELAGPGRDLTIVMGADTAAGLDSWHRSDELAALVTVGVARRHGVALDLGAHWTVAPFEMPDIGISSTDIRRRCRDGEPIDHLVAPGVLTVIATHGLYGFGR